MKNFFILFALFLAAISSTLSQNSNDEFLEAFIDLPESSRERILNSTILLIDKQQASWATSTENFLIPLIDQKQLALYSPDAQFLENSSQASSQLSTRNIAKRVTNFLRRLQWKEKVVLKKWLPQRSIKASDQLTQSHIFVSNFEQLCKLHNTLEVYDMPGFWETILLHSKKSSLPGVGRADLSSLVNLSQQADKKTKFIEWIAQKSQSKGFYETQKELINLADAYRDLSFQSPPESTTFEEAQTFIAGQYEIIKNQFLKYGMKEPATESSLYSDYVELDFFTNISESDYQYLGSNPEEIQLALNKRRRSSELILDRVSQMAERLHHSAQWIKRSKLIIDQTFIRAKLLELGKLAFTVKKIKAVENLQNLSLNSLLSQLADYGPLHKLGDGDFRFALEQVSGMTDSWLKLVLTEFEYMVQVRANEDKIREQIEELQKEHLEHIGRFDDIPELKSRVLQINEFNLDMISRSDADLKQREKNLKAFFDFARRRIEELKQDVEFLSKISNDSIVLKQRLEKLLTNSESVGLMTFIDRDEYIRQKIDLARSFNVRNLAYILNGYNQSERQEVVSMHTRVHEDNLGSLEQALKLLQRRKFFAEEAQNQLKQLLMTARLNSTTITDIKALRIIRDYIEMNDFSPITYAIDPDPNALQQAHQKILAKIGQLAEAVLNK